MFEGKIPKPTIPTSVRISPEFYELAKKNHIKFSEAMRAGLSLLLAEKGVHEYDNKLNLMRRLTLMRDKLEQTSLELEELKEKRNKLAKQ